MKTFLACIFAVCLSGCGLFGITTQEVKSVEDVVATDAELACQTAIAMGVDNNTLKTACADVKTYQPVVDALLSARQSYPDKTSCEGK